MVISHDRPDIIFITECLPKIRGATFSSQLLSLPGYTLFTSFDPEDRPMMAQGIRGICIYVVDGIQAAEFSIARTHAIEQLWIRIRLKGGDLLTAGCIYRSPSGNAHQSVDELEQLLCSVMAESPSHLLICGDFNVPQIDWVSSFCHAPDSHHAHKFLDLIHNNLLFQHVTQPTRFREGETPHVLDLLFTNEEGMMTDLEYLPGLGKSDHIVLRFRLACYTLRMAPAQSQFNFNRANWGKLKASLSNVNWECLSTLDVETGYKFFCETLNKAMTECIPKARSSKARKNIYMSSQALKLKKQKNEMWDKYMHNQDPIDLARFRVCRNRLRSLTRKLRQDFEYGLVNDIKDNPRAFWKYSNSRLKTKPGIGDLRSPSGELECTDKGKADILNTFFAGVFTQEELSSMPVLSERITGQEVSELEVTPDNIRSKLASLNPSSAPGPDGIHPRILRETSHVICIPLALFFNRVLETGAIPHEWKLGRVVPIFKKGDKKDPRNYRPVSLTSVPCKVLESLVRDRLVAHLTDSHLLSVTQHGFRPKRSCNTQLIEVLEDWSAAVESHCPVDVVYLDFQKAFDSVPHQRLLHKLQCYGVTGKLLKWIKSFLSGRRQQVVLRGCASDWTDVDSGVPQGSVLGPLLFLVYINDLPETVQGNIKMFADDTKLYSTVSTPGDGISLQADLDCLVHWSDIWQLPFNESKCKVLHLGRTNPHYQYSMRGIPMSCTHVEKDLGVHIDDELKFRLHASTVAAKATQVLSVIRRSFTLLNEFTVPLLYKSLVRPHLEFGNMVWGPFNRTDQRLLERVQRRATRMVASIRHLPYKERLKLLKLPSLYYRRKRGDMIFLYQLFHGGVDIRPEDFFTLAADGITRGHPFKVLKPRAVCRVRRSIFSVRVVDSWNTLPAKVVCSASVAAFKANLDAHWAHIWYDMPDNG